MTTTETDLRVELLDSLLRNPHGDVVLDLETHKNILDKDPIFYAHLAMWYERNGSIRDHKVLFPAVLGTSRVADMMTVHRGTGQWLLKTMAPYQVARVVRTIKMTGKNVPRSLRNAVADYLCSLEENEARLDGAVLSNRSELKYLYATLHLSPSDRADDILFKDNPPEGSKPWAVKEAANRTDVYERAKIIAEYDIPVQVATSLISFDDPVGLAALVQAMTPQQTINYLKAIKRSGGFDNADIRNAVEAKLQAAKSDKRVSAYKTKVAAQAAGVDSETEDLLEEVRETQLKAKGRITRTTAMLVDISGSQAVGIEVTKHLAPLIASACDSELHVLAFNTAVYPVPKPEDMSLRGMERAMAGLRATGGTSCGLPITWLERNNIIVEQFVYVTDEDENTYPSFVAAYQSYAEVTNNKPAVIIVRVGQFLTNKLQLSCQQLGIEYNAFEFTGDYYALPDVLNYLTGKSRVDLVMEIMETPLPV